MWIVFTMILTMYRPPLITFLRLTLFPISTFYVMHEPAWNGVTYSEYNTICSMVKSDFPNIPIFLTEAWTMLDSLQIPSSVDWVSFDRYGIFKPSSDPTYQ